MKEFLDGVGQSLFIQMPEGPIRGDAVLELGRVAGKCGHSSEDEVIDLMEWKAGKASKRGKSGFRRADYDYWQNSLRNFNRKKARESEGLQRNLRNKCPIM